MSDVLTDSLFDDEPRFDYPVQIEFTCSDLILIFDKQERVFLLKCENDDGVSVKLSLTLHELEHAAIELLLAARAHLGLKPAGRTPGGWRDDTAAAGNERGSPGSVDPAVVTAGLRVLVRR